MKKKGFQGVESISMNNVDVFPFGVGFALEGERPDWIFSNVHVDFNKIVKCKISFVDDFISVQNN